MRELVSRDYYWPGMDKWIRDFVQTCHACARNKAKRHAPYGFLKSLEAPTRPWDDITMDHIVGLPESEGCNAILVVVDRLSKMSKYIPTTETATASDLAQLFIRHVFRHHGLPKSIVSDRGATFTSAWWREFLKFLGVEAKFSTSYHPQTDGQTERVNQELETYLRFYVTYMQNDWVSYLPIAEFARNNSVHSSIKVTPFFANYGYHPRFDVKAPVEAGTAPSAFDQAVDLAELHQVVQKELKRAQERQAVQFNKNHLPAPTYSVGDQVFLNGRNLSTLRPSSKLDAKNYGPFTIIEKITDWAYRLQLGPRMRIHNVFHVDLLEPVPAPSFINKRRVDPPGPVELETDEYEVERILNSDWVGARGKNKGQLEYLVQWRGWENTDEAATWEPAAAILSKELVDDYYQRCPTAAGGPSEPEENKGVSHKQKIRHRRK